MIYKTFACSDCDSIFEVFCESSDPDPDCPTCSKVLQWTPAKVSIGGSTEGKAVKLSQEIMEQDFGLTNFKDNNKEGDVGYIDPNRKSLSEKDALGQRDAEIEREVRKTVEFASPDQKQMVDNFFGGQSVKIGQNSVPASQLLAAGKMGPNANLNPMTLLHKAGKAGTLPTKFRMIGGK